MDILRTRNFNPAKRKKGAQTYPTIKLCKYIKER